MDISLEKIRRLTLDEMAAADNYCNLNAMHDGGLSAGQRIADGVARNMGSWRFIIIQSVILVAWIRRSGLIWIA